MIQTQSVAIQINTFSGKRIEGERDRKRETTSDKTRKTCQRRITTNTISIIQKEKDSVEPICAKYLYLRNYPLRQTSQR